MADFFNLSQGVEIDNLDGIHECYQIDDENILSNISFENLKCIVTDLCKALKAPLFFFIEIPCDEDTEKRLRENDEDLFHKDIYYLDNCTTEVCIAILKRYGDLLLNDGLVQFGFASHEEEDEIYIQKYKILSIFSRSISKYEKILMSHNIINEDKIKTVWDNFSSESSGILTTIDFNGETIFDIVENLKDVGLYFSHRVED